MALGVQVCITANASGDGLPGLSKFQPKSCKTMVPVALTKTKVVWWLESFGVLALLVLPRVGLGVLFCVIAAAQAPAPPAPVKSETPADLFGRDTPRGTVLGFVNASRMSRF
jgi:hypothetical protein